MASRLHIDPVPAIDGNGFVGREQELQTLQHLFASGHRTTVVVGSRGSGKTSLALVFASRYRDSFPGGVHRTYGHSSDQLDELLENLPRSTTEPSLLVVDEADLMDERHLESLESRLSSEPQFRALLLSSRELQLRGHHTKLRLEGLRRDEFDALVRAYHASDLRSLREDPQQLAQLYAAARGNPLFINILARAIVSGSISSWQEAARQFSDFQQGGLFGPENAQHKGDFNDAQGRIIIDVSAANAEILQMLARKPELAWQLPSRKFEEIVAEILEKQGYDVSLTPPSRDGGFDIYAAKKDGLGNFLFLVECKRYAPRNKVGVEIVRSLHGVVQAHQATAGAVVTTSYFTAGAEAFRRSLQHQLQLHDYRTLKNWIEDYDKARRGT